MNREFSRIPIKLKRFSFSSKMYACLSLSVRLMHGNRLNIDTKGALPWEIDILATLSILACDEYRYGDLANDNYLTEAINCIRNYHDPAILSPMSGESFLRRYVQVTGLLQFKMQENTRFRLYRYMYIFKYCDEKFNLNSLFISKFGVDYYDLCLFADKMYLLFSIKNMLAMKSRKMNDRPQQKLDQIINYVARNNGIVIGLLKLTRSEFITEQKQIMVDSNENAYYSFKLLHSFPFIENEGAIYLPEPYLIIDAVTDGIMHRLTIGDKATRDKIGKVVVEKYLLDLLQKSSLYDQVVPEIEYLRHNTDARSPDVMVRSKKYCILFDTKCSVPSQGLRFYDEEATATYIDRYSKMIIQMYDRINEFNVLYHPFGYEFVTCRENIFGVALLLEESYISKRDVYENVRDVLKLEDASAEYAFILSNIRFVGLRDVEEATFSSTNYIDRLIRNKESKQWFDFTLNNWDESGITEFTNDAYLSFDTLLDAKFDEFLVDLVAQRLIEK